MEQYNDGAIEILDELHTERLDYNSEYLPLIDAAQRLAAYENTGMEPEEVERVLDAYGRGLTLRSDVAQKIELVKDIPADRLRELVQADKDGRCVVLPDRSYTNEDGENALKSAMNTCYYHNNPVTRYIADAVAEKLTLEADLKGEQP